MLGTHHDLARDADRHGVVVGVDDLHFVVRAGAPARPGLVWITRAAKERQPGLGRTVYRGDLAAESTLQLLVDVRGVWDCIDGTYCRVRVVGRLGARDQHVAAAAHTEEI